MADQDPDELFVETDDLLDSAAALAPSAVIEWEPIITTVETDLFLSVGGDEEDTTWDPNRVFAAAIRGIVDTILPAVVVCDSHIHSDGDLVFARDVEAPAPHVDRSGSYLLQKKAKERASNAIDRVLKHNLYGNSRSPSRASSRAQSRVSAVLTNSVVAMKVARLAFGKSAAGSTCGGDTAPFRITEWNETSSNSDNYASIWSGKPTTGQPLDSYSALSSRYSLGSPGTDRTSRIPGDYKEVRRRDKIVRDIETREGREQLTARIKRKGDLKLKLRSMEDPSVSVEREEREAAMKSRGGGLLSRGVSRAAIQTITDGAAGPATLTRINSVALHSLAGATSRSSETTYRPEDYEGLASELVILDKKGELLVGENCHLVTRKPRNELQRDLLQRNTVKPSVHFPSHEIEHDGGLDGGESSSSPTAKLAQKPQPQQRTVSRQSPVRILDVPQSALFEGQSGSFQSYPRIELDPKKTPLTKGVTITPPSPPAVMPGPASLVALKEVVQPPSSHSAKVAAKPTNAIAKTKTKVSEDYSNEALETQLTQMVRTMRSPTDTTKQSHGSATVPSSATSRAPTSRIPEPSSLVLPHNNHQPSQISRLRTPAYGNRTGRPGSTVLGISRGEFLDRIDDDHGNLHEAVAQSGTLQTPSKATAVSRSEANLPQFASYVREFPTPPKGQIHIVSSKAAAALVASPTKANSGFPFSSLPSVIRGKR